MSDELTTSENTEPENKKTTKLPLSKRYKKDEIVLAIGQCRGVYKDICSTLGCTRGELQHYLNIHSEIKPLLQDAREEIVDDAEKVLLEKLNSNNEQVSQRAAEFILKNLGKKRGYTDQPQVEVNVKSDGDTQIQIQKLFGL